MGHFTVGADCHPPLSPSPQPSPALGRGGKSVRRIFTSLTPGRGEQCRSFLYRCVPVLASRRGVGSSVVRFSFAAPRSTPRVGEREQRHSFLFRCAPVLASRRGEGAVSFASLSLRPGPRLASGRGSSVVLFSFAAPRSSPRAGERKQCRSLLYHLSPPRERSGHESFVTRVRGRRVLSRYAV